MASKYFKKLKDKISPEADIFVEKSFDIVDQIHLILKEKGITQRELAKSLGKSESEISKWLSGGHNITLRTITKLEAILESEIITTPLKESTKKGNFKDEAHL